MDLRQLEAEPTEDEREAIDARLGSHPQREGTHFAAGLRRDRRHLLLPALQAAQARVGWISEGVLAYICKRLDVPPADAWGVATFYGLLSMEPRPRRVLHVCDDIACRCSGANELIAELERTLGVGDGAAWQRSPCLGLCDQAPAAFLTVAGPAPAERLFGPVTAEQARAVLAPEGTLPAMRRPRPPQAGDPSLRVTELQGRIRVAGDSLEESLRRLTPARGLVRRIKQDCEIGGHQMKAGQNIFALVQSANNDPAHFGCPAKFDLDRDPAEMKKSLHWGLGNHTCIGMPLAKLDMRIAIETVIRRLPNLRCVPDQQIRVTQGMIFHRPERLEFEWDV